MIEHCPWAMRIAFSGALWILLTTQPITATAEKPLPDDSEAPKANGLLVHGLLQRYCVDCHGAAEPEAGVRLEGFDSAAASAADEELLEKLFDVIGSRQMPPPEAESPTDAERQRLTSWLAEQLEARLQEARRSRPWSRNRRLTVEEYNFTLQSLFGVRASFADMLLPDPVAKTGFSNDSELLGISSLHVESYLDSARRAVERYVQFEPVSLPSLRYHVELEDLYYFTGDRYGTLKRAPQPLDRQTFRQLQAANSAAEPRYVDPLTPRLAGSRSEDEAFRAAIPKLHEQFVALPQWIPTGELVLRIRAAGIADRTGRFPRMRVEAGITLGDGCSVDKRTLGEFDVRAPLDKPEVYEFRIRIEDLPTKGPLRPQAAFDRLSVFDMNQIFISNISCDDEALFALGRGGYSDPTAAAKQMSGPLQRMRESGVNLLYLDCLEVEMLPLPTPNATYAWSLPSTATGAAINEQCEVAAQFLQRFMRQAYRRPVEMEEVDIKLELFRALRADDYSFEESLREALAAVLISPSFLFLESRLPANTDISPEEPTPYQLAARLSYFLWLAPPDADLLLRAADDSLRDTAVLRAEADRLLSDPRSRRFLDSFCRQWLRLDKHANVPVDHAAYPAYDEDLALLSLRETYEYFAEVFVSDSSALDLITSDYAILNDRLGEHYDITGIFSGDFRKVDLPSDSVRGGLLTQASLLTMNSDGVDSHPIRRGVWLLDRLLHARPLPPPPDVPVLDPKDPDLRGLSLRERIELHRQPGDCQSCHRKIDPWGIALDNFDATGRWREVIVRPDAEIVTSQPVEAVVELSNGQQIDGVRGLQQHILTEQHEQFTRSLVYHMLNYALGRPLNFADRAQLNALHERFAASQFQLRELTLAIVESPVFRE